MTREDPSESLWLVLLESDAQLWIDKHHQLDLKAGDLILLDAQVACMAEWTAHQLIYAAISRDLLKSASWPAHRACVLHAGDPRTTLLSQHLRALWALQTSGSSPLKTELPLGLASLTHLYFQSAAPLQAPEPQPSDSKLLHSIRHWLDDNLQRSDLDAAAIAARFHLSRSALYELFRPWGGVRAYLQARRLQVARQILETAEQPSSISQLAARLGFRSLSSFSRAFRERWGVSPKQLTKQRPEPRPHTDPTAGEGGANSRAGGLEEVLQHAEPPCTPTSPIRSSATRAPEARVRSDHGV